MDSWMRMAALNSASFLSFSDSSCFLLWVDLLEKFLSLSPLLGGATISSSSSSSLSQSLSSSSHSMSRAFSTSPTAMFMSPCSASVKLYCLATALVSISTSSSLFP
ncbi:unnamed protein product [Pseudo-nitzschia multistriata]|uniref:Uncharacterized protein n=1 Tax=Pseudo-nitzschia multistriata TaxID=183589 RepID=A0A448ZS05_9STRA|nr:unnamed protein product [Pseudo-nitzschia multistriata]